MSAYPGNNVAFGPGGIPGGQQPVYQQGPDGQFHQVGFMSTPGFVAAAPGYAMAQPAFVQQQPVVYVQQAGPGQISYQQQPQPIPSAPEPSPAKKKQEKDKDDDSGCCLCVLCAALFAGCVVYFKAATGME